MSYYVDINGTQFSLHSAGSIEMAYEALDAIIRSTSVGKAFLVRNPLPGDLRKIAPAADLRKLESRIAQIEDKIALESAKAELRALTPTPAHKARTQIRAEAEAEALVRHKFAPLLAKLDAVLARANRIDEFNHTPVQRR